MNYLLVENSLKVKRAQITKQLTLQQKKSCQKSLKQVKKMLTKQLKQHAKHLSLGQNFLALNEVNIFIA